MRRPRRSHGTARSLVPYCLEKKGGPTTRAPLLREAIGRRANIATRFVLQSSMQEQNRERERQAVRAGLSLTRADGLNGNVGTGDGPCSPSTAACNEPMIARGRLACSVRALNKHAGRRKPSCQVLLPSAPAFASIRRGRERPRATLFFVAEKAQKGFAVPLSFIGGR